MNVTWSARLPATAVPWASRRPPNRRCVEGPDAVSDTRAESNATVSTPASSASGARSPRVPASASVSGAAPGRSARPPAPSSTATFERSTRVSTRNAPGLGVSATWKPGTRTPPTPPSASTWSRMER